MCLLDGHENCDIFLNLGGYDILLRKWIISKYLRADALKLLSFVMTACPQKHVYYLVEKANILPVIFGLLMTDFY